MRSNSYLWFTWVSLAAGSVLGLVGVAIAIAGWKRQRHFGYVLIAAWACAGLLWRLVQVPWIHFLQNFVGSTFKGADVNMFMLLSNVASMVMLQGLLLAGIAMLVFRPPLPPVSSENAPEAQSKL